MYVCIAYMYMCMCTPVPSEGQKTLEPLELEKQMFVWHTLWVLISELSSYGREVCTLNHWIIFPALQIILYQKTKTKQKNPNITHPAKNQRQKMYTYENFSLYIILKNKTIILYIEINFYSNWALITTYRVFLFGKVLVKHFLK